jgi:hypothetical protein
MLSNGDYRECIPNFGPPIPSAAFQPEREEGVALDELPVGAVVEVDTNHHTYHVENRGAGKVLIAGHPEYCPEPVLVDLHGSIGDIPVLTTWFIGRGLKMEFKHPTLGVFRTSRVREIREPKPPLAP